VEELGGLDLENFRRMGPNATDRTSEIGEKIELLSEESLPRRFAGLDAWHESSVFKLYTGLGVESIFYQKPLSEVIVDRQVQNKDTIEQSEFDAINNLNQELTI
jgi:hypothetical protein